MLFFPGGNDAKGTSIKKKGKEFSYRRRKSFSCETIKLRVELLPLPRIQS